MRSKLATFLLSTVIAVVRYLMLTGSVQRLMYFRLYPHTTFGLYPSQIVYGLSAFGMLFLMTRFAIVVERRPLPWLILMYMPIVLTVFLSALINDKETFRAAVQDALENLLGVTIFSSIIAFPVRWWQRRRHRQQTAAPASANVDGPVWPPPPNV